MVAQIAAATVIGLKIANSTVVSVAQSRRQRIFNFAVTKNLPGVLSVTKAELFLD